MSSSVVITVVVIAAIIWLAVLAVSALRSRGREEIPVNLAPGEPDESLETSRLERVQQAAVLLSAFLAVGLPLYYLGEADRQAQFEEDFHTESVERGLDHWEEFACASCHGADGSGGAATYTERRSGVSVNWAAPSLNDVFYRFDRDEVRYWITYGRQNTPMPAWGVEGGGPMNEQQIDELLDFLESPEFQVPQAEAAGQVPSRAGASLSNLDDADSIVAAAVVDQRQLIAELERAGELAPVFEDLDERTADLLANLDDGIDTDGDGVADAQEMAVNDIVAEARQALLLPGVEEITFSTDPENPDTVEGTNDLELAEQIAATYRELADSGRAPILGSFADTIDALIANQEGDDTDGDGLADQAETQVGAQTALAVGAITGDFALVNLDPTSVESVAGTPDAETAATALAGIETRAINISLNAANFDQLHTSAEESLAFLEGAQERAEWSFDFETIAETTFDGDVDRARQVVGLFQSNCARCHTSGYSAGIPFTQEAGAGGFAPALHQGRPAIQFLSDETLAEFLTLGTEDAVPYGVNGMGSGRMPAFGTVLSQDDLMGLASWLRDGDLRGVGEAGDLTESEEDS